MKYFETIFSLVVVIVIFSVSIYSLGLLYNAQQIVSAGNALTLKQAQDCLNLSQKVFTENKGQWDEEILFVSNTDFGKALFTDSAVCYQILQGSSERLSSHTVKISFINAGIPIVQGVGAQLNYTNYFKGNEASLWVNKCQNYAKIEYLNIWEGIDLAYYFSNLGLKYEFYLHPNAKTEDLKIRIEGAELNLQDNQLQMHTSLGIIQDDKLTAYTQDTQSVIPVKFIIEGDIISFSGIPKYRSETLIIDPLVYSALLGGDSHDIANSISIDDKGYAYISGYTWSSDFPITPGVVQSSLNGTRDAFIAKINPQGTDLIYSTFLGGSHNSWANNIVIDDEGCAFVAGYTGCTDFPLTHGAFQEMHTGGWTNFIAKINPQGTALIYSTLLGGSDYEEVGGIAIDDLGNVYVAGYTYSSDFPVSKGAYQTTHPGDSTAFLSKLDSKGSSLVYSTFLGGSENDVANALAIDDLGNVYVAGYTESSDFRTTSMVAQDFHGKVGNVFIAKFDLEEFSHVNRYRTTSNNSFFFISMIVMTLGLFALQPVSIRRRKQTCKIIERS